MDEAGTQMSSGSLRASALGVPMLELSPPRADRDSDTGVAS